MVFLLVEAVNYPGGQFIVDVAVIADCAVLSIGKDLSPAHKKACNAVAVQNAFFIKAVNFNCMGRKSLRRPAPVLFQTDFFSALLADRTVV